MVYDSEDLEYKNTKPHNFKLSLYEADYILELLEGNTSDSEDLQEKLKCFLDRYHYDDQAT